MTDLPTDIDAQEQLSRIELMNARVRRRGAQAAGRTRELTRDALIAPFTVILGTLTAGAALFGAGAAFMKLLGP